MLKKISTGVYSYDKHFCSNKIRKKLFRLMSDHERVGKLIGDNGSILDFGCGDCSFFDSLKGKNLKIIGYDKDEKYIKIGRMKKYKVFNSLEEINEKFDFITANQVVEHMGLDELNKFFQKSFDLLKGGGILIVSTLNIEELYMVIDVWNDPTHVRPYTIKALDRAGKDLGFCLVRVIKHHIRINPLKLLIDIFLGFSIYSGITLIFKKK